MKQLIRILFLAVVLALCGSIAEAAPADAQATEERWQPEPGLSWQWQLTGNIDTSYNVDVYDVDAVETPAATVDELHADGRKVICYISAGSWENWRPDREDFPPFVKGRPLGGWPGERWLDIREIDTLRPIMKNRMDVSASKGFDAVEPDNVDGYANRSGFPLTYADQLAYNRMLAEEAHERGEVSGCVAYFDYYAGTANKIHGEPVPLGPDYLNYTIREPLGVTAHIVPWNMPLSMVCRSLAPALAAGNTAVVKPAEQTPLTALKFAEIFLDLGFPQGVYNVVTGFGDEAGRALSEHPGIGSITFTGSVETGRDIIRASAEHVKPVVLELGGKSPQVIFADTDLDLAATEVAKGIYSNTGQYCDAGSRLVVEEGAREPLLERLLEHSRRIKLGEGMDDPDMGPLVSAEHLERVLGYIASGRQEGANMLIGGRAEEFERGYFVLPTVFDDVEGKMRIAREEIFGPVLSVLPFSDEAEAAEIANDSSYGLAAGIFTRDIDRALRFARDIEAGYVMINEYFTGGMGSPFGGYKQSGIGREKGLVALDNYTQTKNVVVKVGQPNGERPR